MPLKAVRVLISFLLIFSITFVVFAQGPTSVDVMRSRISQAKAQIVVKNYGAAIYELENIRRETNDRTIHRVINVLLMHSYLEQGDYKRAQKFLKELHSSKRVGAALDYRAVAGQVVSGAKTQLKRYNALGLNVSDQKLPKAAATDIDNMRKTLEMVVTHSKASNKKKKLNASSLALLEETTNARVNLARDPFDAKRWKNEVSDTREQIVGQGSKVINVVEEPTIEAPELNIIDTDRVAKDFDKASKENKTKVPDSKLVAANTGVPEKTQGGDSEIDSSKKGANEDAEKPAVKNRKDSPLKRPVRIIGSAKRESRNITPGAKKSGNEKAPNPETPKTSKENSVASKTNEVTDGSPLTVGSLLGYATKRVNPVYPRQARNIRMTGIVKVKLEIDEDGKVSKAIVASGPSLLKRAAKRAAERWRFKPFMRGGRPVKAEGFVSFNFSL